MNARVTTINAYSAHADRSDLIRFLAPAKAMGAAIRLVHGDETTALAFADTLRDEGHEDVLVPEIYGVYPLARREASVG